MANRIWRDLRGASVNVYALLIGLVILMVLGLIIAVGEWVNGMWANFARRLRSPSLPQGGNDASACPAVRINSAIELVGTGPAGQTATPHRWGRL